MAPISTSYNGYQFYALLMEMTFKGISDNPVYKQCCSEEDGSKSPIPDGVQIAQEFGMGAMDSRGETSPFTFDAPGAAGNKQAYYTNYAKAAIFTEQLIMFQKYDIVKKVSMDLGKSRELRRNLNIGALLDDAFTGALYTGPDGLPLISASHITFGIDPSGATNTRTNLVANTPISMVGVELMLTAMRRQLSERGFPNPLALQNIKVIVPPEQEFATDRILNPQALEDPTTAQRAMNVLQMNNRKWQIVVQPFVTNANNWFMCDPGDNGIWIVDKQQLTTSINPDIETKGVRYDVRAMWLEIIKMWENIYGATG